MTTTSVSGVRVLHWNPRTSTVKVPLLNRLRLGARVNNFGDLLGPMIVRMLVHGVSTSVQRKTRILTVGSILHFARDGDVVWGSGVNGKIPVDRHTFGHLDVRAVRGPKTRDFLRTRGIACPEVYGDPALLLPRLRPDLRALSRNRSGTRIVPNLNDRVAKSQSGGSDVSILNPTSPVEECLRSIVTAEHVVTSSLHGLVVAEAFDVPVTLVKSRAEHAFKFEDYVAGTGRDIRELSFADSFEEGVDAAGRSGPLPWSPVDLMDAFPSELWDIGGTGEQRRATGEVSTDG